MNFKKMFIEIPKKRLNKIDEIALHNGFRYYEIPSVKSATKDPFLNLEEKKVLLNKYNQENTSYEDSPRLLYYDQPVVINQKKPINARAYRNLNFDVIGISHTVAEMIILNTAIQVLKEEGYKNIVIDINSTGDRLSTLEFVTELNNYYKKNTDNLDKCCQKKSFNENICYLDCENENCQIINSSAPKSINFLSKESSQHLREVLEYLEETNIPYRINDNLFSKNNHYSKIIFEIKHQDPKNKNREIILARGGRYDDAANKIINRRKMSVAGISMQFKILNNQKAYTNKILKPKVQIVHFGFQGRLKSLEVIDVLRSHGIPIYHNMHHHRLSDQFEIARQKKIPYVITIGQKEVEDGEILFHDRTNASQQIFKMNKLNILARRLK